MIKKDPYDMVEELEQRLTEEFDDIDAVFYLLSYSLKKLKKRYSMIINIEDVLAYAIREALEDL